MATEIISSFYQTVVRQKLHELDGNHGSMAPGSCGGTLKGSKAVRHFERGKQFDNEMFAKYFDGPLESNT